MIVSYCYANVCLIGSKAIYCIIFFQTSQKWETKLDIHVGIRYIHMLIHIHNTYTHAVTCIYMYVEMDICIDIDVNVDKHQ